MGRGSPFHYMCLLLNFFSRCILVDHGFLRWEDLAQEYV
jgi:hypothetical protein